jgi:hypothetical protein
MSQTVLKPTYVVVDGLNVMGRASNQWSMDSWFGLIQVLMILKSVSSRVFGGLEVITVLREHGSFQREYVSERLEHVSRLSRLILLSESSEREDDDFLVMSLTKLYDGFFVSHDLSIQKHIDEDVVWADARRILIHLDPITRGVRLEIPPGVVSDGYAKMSLYNHLTDLLEDGTRRYPLDKEEESEVEEYEPGSVSMGSDICGFEAAECSYCGVRVDSIERAEEHSRNTGHNHYRGWSLPSGGMTLGDLND